MNKGSIQNDKKRSKSAQIAHVWTDKNEQNVTDVLGSYTGTPRDDDQPEQDADDL